MPIADIKGAFTCVLPQRSSAPSRISQSNLMAVSSWRLVRAVSGWCIKMLCRSTELLDHKTTRRHIKERGTAGPLWVKSGHSTHVGTITALRLQLTYIACLVYQCVSHLVLCKLVKIAALGQQDSQTTLLGSRLRSTAQAS